MNSIEPQPGLKYARLQLSLGQTLEFLELLPAEYCVLDGELGKQELRIIIDCAAHTYDQGRNNISLDESDFGYNLILFAILAAVDKAFAMSDIFMKLSTAVNRLLIMSLNEDHLHFKPER